MRTRVLGAARKRLPPADAEDVAQETLLLLATKYAHVSALDELVAIGAQVVRYKCAERWRKSTRRRALGETPLPTPSDDAPDPVDGAKGEGPGPDQIRQGRRRLEQLLAVLEQPTPWERVRAWFDRPATLLDLAAVGGLVLAALAGIALLQPRPTGSASAAQPLGTALAPTAVAALLQLPAHEAVPAGIEIADGPDAVFAPGEPVHLRVTLRGPARVVVLQEAPGGAATQAWPGLGQAPALVKRPDSGGPAILPLSLVAARAAGTHRVRLVVAPAALDLGSLDARALAEAAPQLTLVDLGYQVKAHT